MSLTDCAISGPMPSPSMSVTEYLPSLPFWPWNLATSEAYVRAETYPDVNIRLHSLVDPVRPNVCRRRNRMSRWKLTWESAGAHRARFAWRRHCRAGAAKERAANMLRVSKCCYNPIGAALSVGAGRRGGWSAAGGLRKARIQKNKAPPAAGPLRAAPGTFRLGHALLSLLHPRLTPEPHVAIYA
jgi:hypothetical protein